MLIHISRSIYQLVFNNHMKMKNEIVQTLLCLHFIVDIQIFNDVSQKLLSFHSVNAWKVHWASSSPFFRFWWMKECLHLAAALCECMHASCSHKKNFSSVTFGWNCFKRAKKWADVFCNSQYIFSMPKMSHLWKSNIIIKCIFERKKAIRFLLHDSAR